MGGCALAAKSSALPPCVICFSRSVSITLIFLSLSLSSCMFHYESPGHACTRTRSVFPPSPFPIYLFPFLVDDTMVFRFPTGIFIFFNTTPLISPVGRLFFIFLLPFWFSDILPQEANSGAPGLATPTTRILSFSRKVIYG